MKTKKEILRKVIMDNHEIIIERAKKLITDSYIAPSFSGWTYRIVAFIDDEEQETGYIDYMHCSSGKFMAEWEGDAIHVCSIDSDYGYDVDLGHVEDSLTVEQYEEYKSWYMKKEEIEDEDELDEDELNCWSLLKEYDKSLYDHNFEQYVDYIMEHHLDKVYRDIDETLEFYLGDKQ